MTDENTANDWAKLALKFSLKLGGFKKTSFVTRNKKRFASITSVFKKKGAKAARAESAKLHTELLKSGEIPRTMSASDLSSIAGESETDLPNVEAMGKEIARKMNVATVVKSLGLQRIHEKDLREIGELVWENGTKCPKAKKTATALVKASPISKLTADIVVDAVYEKMFETAV